MYIETREGGRERARTKQNRTRGEWKQERRKSGDQRTRNMIYAVGMIVTCIKNDLNQTGVIIGWDEKFNYHVKIKYNCTFVLSDSRTWDTAGQPFYIILSEDGNVYYAAQDTLIEASPRWIEHSEIGRYFCRFTNVYYVPNEVLTRHYPYDQAIILI